MREKSRVLGGKNYPGWDFQLHEKIKHYINTAFRDESFGHEDWKRISEISMGPVVMKDKL